MSGKGVKLRGVTCASTLVPQRPWAPTLTGRRCRANHREDVYISAVGGAAQWLRHHGLFPPDANKFLSIGRQTSPSLPRGSLLHRKVRIG